MDGVEHPIFGTIDVAVRAWDFAATEKKASDFTASCLMASTSKNYRLILDVTEDKLSPGDRDQLVRTIAEIDGRSVYIFIEQEGGASGTDLIFNYVKLLKEFNIAGHRPSASKYVRAQGLSSWFRHGLVKMVRGPWNTKFVNQLKAFPNGEHDDMVDAASCAFNRLATVNTWRVQGPILAASSQQIRPMTSKQIEEMEDGTFKDILQHAKKRRR